MDSIKPILCLVACGDKYTPYIPSSIEKFSEKYDLCILTDKTNRLYGVLDQEIYTSKIFSYFDKLLFSARMALKHKQGVYYCDINKLEELDNLSVDNDRRFYYIRPWPVADYFYEMEYEEYWRDLVWFWRSKSYNYKNLPTIEEHAFYLPYTNKLNDLLYVLEEIKPVFEYTSLSNEHPYKGIGNGEGLALSYALDVVGIL